MILIQTYQELYYSLKVLQMLKESDEPLYKKLKEKIQQQLQKLA